MVLWMYTQENLDSALVVFSMQVTLGQSKDE
jgi:hypothetical protein